MKDRGKIGKSKRMKEKVKKDNRKMKVSERKRGKKWKNEKN